MEKNGPKIPTMQVPSVSRVKRGMSKPEGSPAKLYNGRDVIWKRVIVEPMEVKNIVVFGDNERNQALITPASIKDITDSMSRFGPDKAAMGRINDDGVIEVADGSRRRAAAFQELTPYPIDLTDLTDEEMLHLSITGNIYRKPSVYEHGQRYLNLQESLMLNDTQLVEYLSERGENVSRRNVRRYINTASLPLEVIQAFNIANDCTAEIGEKLWRSWSEQGEGCTDLMEVRAVNLRVNSNLTDPKDILTALLGEVKKQEAPTHEKLHKLAIVKPMKNGGTAIELSADIEDHTLAEIKKFIELTLG